MGCFGVPRCHETAGNKEKQGEKDKEIEKEETKNGIFFRFWPFLCPPIEVTAKHLLPDSMEAGEKVPDPPTTDPFSWD